MGKKKSNNRSNKQVKISLRKKSPEPEITRNILSVYGDVVSEKDSTFYTLNPNENFSEGAVKRDLHKSGFYTSSITGRPVF